MSKESLYKKIDEFLFSKIEVFEKSEQYHQMNSFLGNLEDSHFKILKNIFYIISIILPLTLVLFFKLHLNSKTDELEVRENMIKIANEIILYNQEFDSSSMVLVSPITSPTNSSVRQKILNITNNLGIDSSSIAVNNVDNSQLDENITETLIKMKINNLSNDQLFDLLHSMLQRDKIHINNLQISKNQTSNLLEGEITSYFYSKNSFQE